MNSNSIILGTRGSALALAQATQIRALLHKAIPKLKIEIKIIKTSGDKQTGISLIQSGIKGLFTKELEEALIRRKIDVAIHSTKDLPTELPMGLQLSAVTKREDPRDVLIGHPETDLQFPRLVYTSSPRRVVQARLLWPKSNFQEIRGNVETRLSKLSKGKPGDALLLAAAGLRRLDFLKSSDDEGTLIFDPKLPYRKLSIEEMIPSPGQAAIGLETRAEDGETQERLKCINHSATWWAVLAERSFLHAMGGGCSAPMAAHAVVSSKKLTLHAVSENAGHFIWRGELSGTIQDAVVMGKELADRCKTQSA